jgi:hypothetical protein
MREIKFKVFDRTNEFMIDILGFVYESDTQVRIWYKTLNGIANESFSTDRIEILQYLNQKDKNGNRLCEGDLVIGYRHRLPTDGYTKKGFPEKIRYILEVKYHDEKGMDEGFYLSSKGVHEDDQFSRDEYQYRSIQYQLQESRECNLVDNKVQWKGVNETLERIGNIYQDSHLIPQYNEHKHHINQ